MMTSAAFDAITMIYRLASALSESDHSDLRFEAERIKTHIEKIYDPVIWYTETK